MSRSPKFLLCPACGNLVHLLEGGAAPIACCGRPMAELTANSTEASGEKHLPIVTQTADQLEVQVGSAAHPMSAEHAIRFIHLETMQGAQQKRLTPEQPPKAVFCLCDDQPIAAYAWCNLHGLWRTPL
ncbi:MAG: desulfoferrodoxin family protein [Oscillospiraceae bacterium]